MRRLRIGATAVLSVLCIIALASAAAASAAQFRAQPYPATVSSAGISGNPAKFKFGNTVKCSAMTTTAVLGGASGALEETPTPTGCTLAGVFAEWVSNGCHLNYASTNEEAPLAGSWAVSCKNTGEAIEITSPSSKCVVTIPAQGPLPGISFTNEGSGVNRVVSIAQSVAGITYFGGFHCPAEMQGSHGDGTLTGPALLTGSSGGGPAAVYVANQQIEQSPKFTSVLNTEVRSTQWGQFTWNTGEGVHKCKEDTGVGNFSGSSSELVQAPIFSGCSGGGTAWYVQTNGCTFGDRVVSQNGAKWGGGFSIRCSPGKAITLEAAACLVTVPAQEIAAGATYSNETAEGVKMVSGGIFTEHLKYSQSRNCVGGVKEGTNGELSATWFFRAYKTTGQQTDLFIQ